MHRRTRYVFSLILGAILAMSLLGCGSEDAPEAASPDTPTEQAEVDTESAPLPDEDLYLGVLAAGLDFSYQIGLANGEIVIVENMEGYGSLRWTDAEDRNIIVARRYVTGEPEEWTYVDEGVQANGVTELEPTGEQLLAWDNLAGEIVTAAGGEPQLTRGYAWTSPEGIGSTIYATGDLAGGSTDDPNLRINFGEGGLLGRFDFTLP